MMSKKKKITDLRVLRVKDGDIVAVKDDVVRGRREEFVEHFKKVTNAHALLLFVKNLSDIRILNEKQMESAGWVPAEWKELALKLQAEKELGSETD